MTKEAQHAKALNAEATDQWNDFLQNFSPGIRYSDLPAHFQIPIGQSGRMFPVHLDGAEFHQTRWDEIPEFIQHVVGQFQPSWELPKGWSYKKLAKGITPNRFDLSNPRTYTLEGQLLPWTVKPYEMYEVLEGVFAEKLIALFQDELPNHQSKMVKDFLSYHHDNGGLPDNFHALVTEVLESWEHQRNIPKKLKAEVSAWMEVRRKAVAKAKQPQKDAPMPLKDRFPKPEQYARFIELLQEHEIVDAGGAFIHGHGRKSRLFGAYQGASENPALRFSTGSLPEIVATLNGAFSNLELSAGKPQDLHGTKGHTKMRKAFREAVFP